ncbi:uncharacterized protein TNIN_346731 [Trichonephila inaurata madagascariensis]|uniref:Uncharacterized protein n=1 Tax=Trichonephila inaurata madagascariensis TaxID=2747483 RepID=A0A8X6YFI3_9ARAC|nr:uncharacterized protein TNIN_346731 [Trichonephila inaurata madagascariensis]
MTDMYGGNPFLVPDAQSRDATLDASQVLAAALEQMDDIIAATNHEIEIQSLEKKSVNRPSNISTELYPTNTFFPINVSETHGTDGSFTISHILNNLKDCILANDGNDNFISNQELSISSAKIVYNWLQKLLEDKVSDTQV